MIQHILLIGHFLLEFTFCYTENSGYIFNLDIILEYITYKLNLILKLQKEGLFVSVNSYDESSNVYYCKDKNELKEKYIVKLNKYKQKDKPQSWN